jgi:hypothetical protein
MQVFVDAWINQCRRHGLDSELIIVEWNPPAERARLAQALRWPVGSGPCRVRIIQVPGEIHARYRHAAALPLYQMIAKNVGIRRARGQFILATNVDIVFSDEIMSFLASRKLEKGRMYRVDRTDVMSDVSAGGTLDEQLAYCRSHVLRLCACEGVFRLTPDGLRENEPKDIVAPEAGIHFGPGWFPVERYDAAECFRYIERDAEVAVDAPAGGGILAMEVEPGPGLGEAPHVLQVVDEDGAQVAEWTVEGRATLKLAVPPGAAGRRRLRLVAPDSLFPIVDDPRILGFRFFRMEWSDWASKPVATPRPSLLRVAVQHCRTYGPLVRSHGVKYLLGGVFRATARLIRSYSVESGFGGSVWLAARLMRPHGLGSLLGGTLRGAFRLIRSRGEDVFEAGMVCQAAGGWHELEHAGPERYRWLDQEAVLAVRGSGDLRCLALLVEPGPGLGFQHFTLVVRSLDGREFGRAPIGGLSYVEIPLPLQPGTLATLSLTAEGGDAAAGSDPRSRAFRIFACGMLKSVNAAAPDGDDAACRIWPARVALSQPPAVDWPTTLAPWKQQIADMCKPMYLHLYACGDFTLMAREHWLEVRGYAELDLFSMHVDSMLCYAAHHAGAQEEVLPAEMRIFHIEHGAGSGWTPEGQDAMYARIARMGIPSVTYEDLTGLIAQMRMLRAPVIFNLEDWGLAKISLPEDDPAVVTSATAPQVSG